MSEDRTAPKSGEVRKPYQKVLADSYYGLLGVHPSASMRDIRQAYRDLSKLYHPDTTNLPTAIATAKFQQLNEAYATLSNPERRGLYDRKIGYSSVAVIQPLPDLSVSGNRTRKYSTSSAYLDPTDRPLSPGELFALFILGVTLIGCLCLAVMVGLTRGEALLQPKMVQNDTVTPIVQPKAVTVTPAGHTASSSVPSREFESDSAPSSQTVLAPALPSASSPVKASAPAASSNSLPATPRSSNPDSPA